MTSCAWTTVASIPWGDGCGERRSDGHHVPGVVNFFGNYFWPSQHEYVKPAIGGSMLFIGNARVVINTVFAGIFDRHPKLKMVSVESGIGWGAFILETIDWELAENAPV